MAKEIEITISEDGNVTIDQIGYSGRECVGDMDELIDMLGIEISVEKKEEFNRITKKIKKKQKFKGR
ncbi:MAG: DUF2997 domain-containing protein [Phenylobacterium sp.]